MSSEHLPSATEQSLRALSTEIAGRSPVVAICECGEGVYSPRPEIRSVLLIMDEYADGLRYHTRRVKSQPVTILAADKSLVRLDAEKGAMGEFIVERLLTPYRPLVNGELLRSIEVDTKERVVREELLELILEYGEMARELSIQKEYLMLARLRKRARVFLPAARVCTLLLERSVRDANLRRMAPGYDHAIGRLVDANILKREDSVYALEDSFVDQVIKRKSTARVINIVSAGRRALQAYLAHGRAAYLTPDVLTKELASSLDLTFGDVASEDLEDPKMYLSAKTVKGEVSLAERFSIEKFAGEFRPDAVITVSPLGNVLNEVYMITAGEEQLVAKRFTEWQGFKWFTLGLVSLGTRVFSVSGRARLENEYAINRYLSKRGVRVPEIVHISVPDRVLVERYISGSSLVELVKEAVAKKTLSEQNLRVAYILGSTLAKVHRSGVAIGDTKPENFQRSREDEVYCLDLEQARKSGDKAWDVAELLYYSGHYVFPTLPSGAFRDYVRAFIIGYMKQGDASVLKTAAGVRYGRVFSLWTPPLAIREVSKALRSAA